MAFGRVSRKASLGPLGVVREAGVCCGLEGEGRRNISGRVPRVSSKMVTTHTPCIALDCLPSAVCIPDYCERSPARGLREEGTHIYLHKGKMCQPGTEHRASALQALFHVAHETTL